MHLPLGTLVNIAAVIVGSGAGLLLLRNFPERYRATLLTAGGLATLALGAQMAVKCGNPLVLIGSLYLGALIGEALGIEAWLERVGERIRAVGVAPARPSSATDKVDAVVLESETEDVEIAYREADSKEGRAGATPPKDFTHGLVTAFLLFCVGPMTFVGALNEGISGDHTLLFVKSGLDLFSSFVLASSFGSGVLFSVIPLAIFQLAITLIGALLGEAISTEIVTEMTAVGGTLIIGLGLNMLGVAKLRVANLLPALVVVILVMLALATL
ncbi:MAG: DUF554 domain-containing protein [bacterium]|nr:DUF554 domain-containing protein [bacterium]